MRVVAVNCMRKTFCFSHPQGSYDHTLKLFDARVDKSVMNMDHGQPVESLLLYPSEGLLVSAGTKCAFSVSFTSFFVHLHHAVLLNRNNLTDAISLIYFRGTICESVGPSERRSAPCFS